MRILYLINAPGPRLNGACRCTLLLARHAVERGCVVCIGAPQGSAIHAAGAAVGIPTAVMPMTYGPLSLRTLRREVRSFGPDIVHAMSFVPLTLAGLPRRDARLSVRARNQGLATAGPGLTGTLTPLDPGVHMLASTVTYPSLAGTHATSTRSSQSRTP